jgi:hypothetical protein
LGFKEPLRWWSLFALSPAQFAGKSRVLCGISPDIFGYIRREFYEKYPYHPADLDRCNIRRTMNVLFILSDLTWLFVVVLILSTLKVSGACSTAEQWQADKKLSEKWRHDPDHSA